jgi:hypothetical protein
VLASATGRRAIPRRTATPGLLVEVASGSFVGAVVSCDAERVVLEDRRGRRRSFALGPGAFLVDDVAVELVPVPAEPVVAPAALGTTASGSVPATDTRAKVARASRILVEGIHDAVLLERVWGDDLRAEGVVVEVLDGADDLAAVVAAFGPSPQRRLGILLDHLVEGSKEHRLAEAVRHPDVLVTSRRSPWRSSPRRSTCQALADGRPAASHTSRISSPMSSSRVEQRVAERLDDVGFASSIARARALLTARIRSTSGAGVGSASTRPTRLVSENGPCVCRPRPATRG